MMLRSAAGWSLTFVLVLGGFVACSSKSTSAGMAMGGDGAIVGGSSTGAMVCHYTSDCDGGLVCDIKRGLCVVCRTDSDCGPHTVCEANDCVRDGTGGAASTGGTSASGGSAPRGGTGGTATGGTATGGTATGGATGLCADTTVTCVDATNASSCNPDTGKVDTFNCADEAKAIGIVSSGCTKDALNGDFCSLDSFTDQACADGTAVFGYCENVAANDQLVNVYINCFLDNMGGHTIIPCFTQYVTPTMKTSQDCVNAENACFGGGGAPPVMTGSAGAGGAP